VKWACLSNAINEAPEGCRRNARVMHQETIVSTLSVGDGDAGEFQ